MEEQPAGDHPTPLSLHGSAMPSRYAGWPPTPCPSTLRPGPMLRFCKASSREHAEELLEHPMYWAICLTPGETWAMAWSEDLDRFFSDVEVRNKAFTWAMRADAKGIPLPIGGALEASETMVELLVGDKPEFKGFTSVKPKKKK